ncbi:MAG: NAD-dependent epimerase/dehydratase family protein [Gammaproteobacteria bacterium]|nr:NAD-dependent epimerase/dehydratase family protein [Gammaproteobacteria bacterium]
MRDQTCLVVGGHGFIGQHLVRRLCDLGAKVVVLSPKSEAPIVGCDYKFYKADIEQIDSLANLKDTSFNHVYNLAGYIDHSPFFKTGSSVINNHFIGLLNLLQNLDRSSLKSFVQVGSSDEYGGLDAPQVETMREAPISPYSLAKTSATQLIQMLSKTEQLPGVVLRFFLVYGPGQNDKRFLPQIIQGCLANKSFPTSTGAQLRDFCYIDDVIDAILMASTNEQCHGEVFNIASGAPMAIKEMIQTIVGFVGAGDPQFGQFPDRIGENKALYANIQKAETLLGWTPRVSLEEGLNRTISYYRDALKVNKETIS